MSGPIRHEDSERNDRKTMKFVRDLTEELNYLLTENVRLKGHIEYALGRIHRINNRLRAE
jgi:hypothetical protein